MRTRLWLALAVLAGLSTACAGIVAPEQPATDPSAAVRLVAGTTAGQTFTARQAGLAGLEVFLAPDQAGTGMLRLQLRSGPPAPGTLAEADALVEAVLPLSTITAPAYYRFSFSPQADSAGRDYYAEWSLEGTGSVLLGRGPADAYLDGAAYVAGQPDEAQSAFRLVYAPQPALLGLAGQALAWLGFTLLLGTLLLAPGLALLGALRRGPDLPWPARLGLALAPGLGLYPLLIQLTSWIGLRMGALYAWLPLVLGLGFLAWQARHADRSWARLRGWLAAPDRWPDLAYLLLALALVGTRFFAVRGLDAAPWGDAVQHTLVPQLLLDHGGLFESWEPYTEIATFTYHFGFHAAAAGMRWLTGLPALPATLWTAQALNVLAVLALYPLAWRLGGSRWAGVAAVAIAGLVSPMPMFYVNWGRFTQLAGLTVLPGAVELTWEAVEHRDMPLRRATLAGLALAGLGLAHYRVLVFGAALLAVITLWEVRRGGWGALGRAGLAAGIGGLLFLPWFVHTFSGSTLGLLAGQLSVPVGQVDEFTRSYNQIGDLFFYLPAGLWLALPLAVGWGLSRRQPGVAAFSLGWFVVLLAANPHWLGLPGQGALSNFTLFTAAYLPVGTLVGAACGWLVGRWAARAWEGPLLLVVVAATAVWLSPRRLADVNAPAHAMVTRADLRAAAWIRDNTPAEARFLINAFPAFGGGVIVGSDGGWWLPVLTGRKVTVPPINYSFEHGPRPDYREWMNALLPELWPAGPASTDALQALRERGVTHVYIGQRQGRVNYAGPEVLAPQALLADAHFRPVYHQDRVWIFVLLP